MKDHFKHFGPSLIYSARRAFEGTALEKAEREALSPSPQTVVEWNAPTEYGGRFFILRRCVSCKKKNLKLVVGLQGYFDYAKYVIYLCRCGTRKLTPIKYVDKMIVAHVLKAYDTNNVVMSNNSKPYHKPWNYGIQHTKKVLAKMRAKAAKAKERKRAKRIEVRGNKTTHFCK